MRGKNDEKDSEQEDTVCPHFLKQREKRRGEETASLAKSFAKEPRY
jgi:hypothetical protein